MKKKFVRLISAVLSAAMTLTAVPLSAFAEGEEHTHDGESNVITTPLDFREKTADENGVGWSWDYDTKTLTLNGVSIQATTEENMMSVVTVPDGTKIVLNGENTIVQTNTGDSDTYVLSAVNNKEVNCDGTMTISGDGVLNAENRSTDSMARSLGGSIILNGGTVNATGTVKTNSLEIHNDGVLNANATTASFEGVAVNVSGGITVDGNGSLTAVGCANESTLNSAILLTSNFDKISVSENGSITVPEGNAARVGIYYSGNNGDGMDAEISGGKVTAYGAKYGIYKVNLIMNGTGSVYTTGGSYAIGQTVPTIDENEFVIKGSTEFKASESAVTGEVKYNSGYYEIGGADAKTVVIKPDTSPRIILGKQTGIFKTEEYEIIEGMTDTKLKGTVYFDITLKNMSDEEFADARGYFGGDEPDLSASIIKTDYGWVCMVCDTEFSVTYDTDNTLTIKCGDIVSNTVQVKSNANRFNKVTQGDNTNRTVFYTNTSQEEKDNYKLVSTYTVDSESISYNWYSTNSAYSADELGAAVSGSNGEFKLADNIPAGNYVLYCDITYSDGDSTETVTEKFTFTYKECAHENGYSDGKCTNCGALCDHSDIDIGTGKCNKCEHQFVATISTDGNAPTGYDTLADCLDSITADTGNYVKIYQDIGDTSATATLDTIDVKHNVMIDLNGHKLNNIKLGVNKDVKLALTGTAGSYVTQVYVRKGGSFVIDSDANVEFNTIFVEDSAQLAVSDGAKVTTEQLTVIASVNDDGTTTTSVKLATGMKLGGLTYHRQNNSGALKLGNLLDVTRQTLRREDNGNYLDLYKEYGSMGYSVALTVVEHTDADHKYGSGTGKCEECGKPCEHGGDINTDTGICSVCGAVVSVALYTDKNGSLKYVDTDELDSLLNEYNGSGTIKLFKDYDNSKAQYDLYGELTIDLNGRRLNIRSITPCKNGKLTIKNSGNPVMLGCNVYPTNDASYAGGTLIIDGDVVLDTSIYVYDSSTVILKAGAYPAGLYARDSKTLYDMLGEGKAFFKTDGTLFNASVKEISSSETLTVKDHSHTYVDGKCGCGYVCTHSDVDSETGKCTICGKRCGHTDVDSKTGVCSTCKYQLTAGISGVGTAKYFDNIDDAFSAALSEVNSGCTLTLYKHCEITQNADIGNTTVTVDVNGYSLGGEADISVNDGGVLYLKDSRKSTYNGCIDAPFSVNGGTLINGTADGGSSAADVLDLVINSAKCVEIYGGIFENVYIAHASGVALYGGRYNTIGGMAYDSTPVNTLLAKGYAFAILNSVTHLPESIVDGSAKTIGGRLTNVMVVAHTHTYNETNTKCACGAVLYAKVTSADGTTNEYFDSIEEGLLYADKAENKGCVFTLVTSGKIKDYATLSNGQFTITAMNNNCVISASGGKICIEGADVIAEGHMLINCSIDMISGSLTLPEGSGTRFGTIIISGGTVNISEGVNADNNAGADKLFIANATTDAKVTIGGGTYGNVAFGMLKLKDVLASGVRVIRYDNSSDPTAEKIVTALLYSDIAEESYLAPGDDDGRYYLFTKCEHKNEDGSYAFNDSGICKYCNSEFAASVSYTVDGSAKTELFGDIYDAFDKANEAGTATITLCRDIADSEIAHEINVTGNVTLALNGKTLGATDKAKKIYICGSTLTVNGNGKVWSAIEAKPDSKLTITNGEYYDVYALSDSEVVILDGIIDCLSVYGTGKAEVSGGKFKYLFMYNGKAIESVLADGYAYKNADGTWLSIDEREKDSYLGGSKGALSVEGAPIKSASIAWADEGTPVIYRNGAKKLKVNVTCDVADTSKRITYSDYVNGNNRSKDSKLSVNWYMVFGYKIGEIVAEDGEVEYYTVLKCDGYEYKSNVLKFTLATCSHPEDSFNNETDGLVFCGICDLLIEAEVVDADGKSLGYAGLNRAIKLAQENEGSTVKLISERVPASITVTGGKFTVDFNGKEAYYQFTVNGGDVTFTSSAVQDVSNQNLPSGITVNGTDAEVTIDGKIKLGSVTISSGALAVNSAESYIKELSINGGKTVVNGANIDALKANGGNTVINYVTADSLSVNINGSGSISIVTGEFGSTTCKTDSGYTLGMAIASGSVVFGNNINGFTIYTYEAIQTMTKTDRIFVDKCVHKGEKGSYVLDGNPCPYCNEEIVATVSYTANGSKNTDLFSDIYDAFDKANEIGTATVTLQKNITDDITDTIAVTGNVTLELNGKRLSQPGTDVWYSIEVTSGKLTVNGSGLIKRVAVRNGSNAEINGGTFSDFIIKDGGNAVIKGGQFYSLQVSGEGRNVGQLLADGYAYRSIIDSGIWSTIAEREKQDITNVEVKEAPIKSATATVDKTVLYRNGGGARQILFNFNVNTSDGYTISDANKVTVGLYVGDTLIRELDFVGNSYTFANADEISDTDGTVKAHLVIKLNGYEYVTDDVEFEIATCTHPYDALTTDEYDYYRCSLCDASINAILVKTNGDKACYTDNVPEAFEAAQLEENNGCTLELYRGVNRDCEITQGSFTVLFKKTGSASAVIKVSGGNVKITGDDGCTLSKYPGSSVGYLIAVTGGTVTFDDITINDDSISVSGGKTVINGGTYNKLSVSGGTVTINSGTFSSIDVSAEGKALKDLLGENKAFATSDGKLFDASKVSESDNSLTVIDHSKHEYDETGRCGCGYQCAHSEINAEGVCNECNAKMYVAVTVKSETGTTVKYFTKLTEAFEFAAKNENKGCTLKMLRDFFDRNTDINVNGGELTVDMNGFGVYFNSFNGSGTQITIRSDSKCTFGVENGFSMDGGTVTFSGEVSVVCQNVKLNATYFSSYVETLKIDTLILEDGVLLKQLASITNANIANIDCSSEIYLYQILASGSRVDSQLYSDLKANASSNFDNVRIIRCDHPDGVGRDNRCIYCNSLIAASVSYTENGAEKTEYFVKEDLGKAFAKANSVASATITMLMSSAYDTDYLPVTGDVTLIANGDNAILYNTVKVADGGKLTLRGNANIFAVIAEPGSRLTAEEATRIAYLTVNGGDVKLSGGQYDNITVKDGKITDILGNGYAYKKTEGGAWLTLKEREVSEASGVTVAKAPIVQATLSTEINKLYRNSNANPTLKFNLSLANGSNLNDSYVSKRYGINSYVSGDIIYSSLSALVKDAKLSADEIIDKAGNSVAAKIYFVVITDDGYEIKSNTVSIDLVDCDHSQVVDPTADKETAGNITEPTYCEICESKFNAKITKGDDVRYYNNLDEAAKDAQKSENEGCTLYPLYNKNGYGGQLVITEGNFTLKYAVRTAFSRPIIINGKAKLTVTGRCAVTAFENQDAFIVQGGDVTFDGLATGSNVTINGGNVTMTANNINCLTINGGNVSISSGGFAEIVTTVSDKVIADYIDPGFWVQDRGTKEWIDIYSLNKATASSTNGLTVRVCPMQIIKPIDTVYYTNGYYPDGIPSLQISAVPWYSGEVDAKVAYQWIGIDENGNETEIEGATDRKLSLENLTTGRYYCRLTYSNAATAGVSMKSDVVTATITECKHSGGEATCTEKAKCEICGAEYGEPLGHDYVVIKVVEPDYRNEGYSVFECTRCKDSYIGNRVPVKPIPDVEEIAVEKTTYNEVDISWKNISGVDGYYVECYVGNQWKQINCSADGDRVAAKLSGLSAGLKYKVRIAAYAGRFTAKFRCFYVDTVPSPVWNINTVKATDETVRISWSRNARADGYKVEWYINNQWSAKTVTGNNNISAVIDGLCAGTRYKVRVSAYKGDLYSPYTYGYIDTLPSKVTGITQTVTSSSFTLKWDKNESADGYTVQYYADGKWNEKTLTGNKKTTVTIGSLKGYKTYKVRIKAYKGELESAFDDIYITTAPTKVSGLKVKSAVDSKAVVIWNADANADGYNVEYYIGGKWVKKTITDNKTAKAVLGGLTPYITYKVRVRAYKDNLYGDYSYTTVTAVLSPVTNIKVVSAKRNSITVKWGKNASADGYKVEIYKGGKWVKKTLKGSTNATVTIGGLRAGSVYKVRIASYKGANTSTYTYANVKTAK